MARIVVARVSEVDKDYQILRSFDVEHSETVGDLRSWRGFGKVLRLASSDQYLRLSVPRRPLGAGRSFLSARVHT